jgi:hypothetical protein
MSMNAFGLGPVGWATNELVFFQWHQPNVFKATGNDIRLGAVGLN